MNRRLLVGLACVVVGGIAVAAQSRAVAQAPAAACRTFASAYRTDHTGRGFTGVTVSSCSFDRAALELHCTHNYSDNQGTSTVTTVTTRYQSIGDVVDEGRVVPPLRKSLWTTSQQRTATGTFTTRLTNTYDAQGRLTREDSANETTDYGGWDAAGRPTTARSTTTRAGTTTRTMSYANQAMLTAYTTGQGALSCNQQFDGNGNEVASSCTGPAGSGTGSRTSISATAQVCR